MQSRKRVLLTITLTKKDFQIDDDKNNNFENFS